jgi:hypothetical protein
LTVELLSAEYAAAQQRSNSESKMETDFCRLGGLEVIASSSPDGAQAGRAAVSWESSPFQAARQPLGEILRGFREPWLP